MLLLVDGTNLVMRYASAMVGDASIDPTIEQRNTVLDACLRAILACGARVRATHVITALDSSVESWRRALYPAYKAKRTTPTGAWTNRLNSHLTDCGVLALREAGFEADDIIATLATRSERGGREVTILSGDSDLLQCSSLLVRVVQFGKHPEPKFVPRTLEWIREHYDIPTAGHLAAYKALVGEPGDNIPGVPGIGPVKARKLLALAPTIDDIPKLLSEGDAEAYRLALHLVTLRTDVPVPPIHPAECRITYTETRHA